MITRYTPLAGMGVAAAFKAAHDKARLAQEAVEIEPAHPDSKTEIWARWPRPLRSVPHTLTDTELANRIATAFIVSVIKETEPKRRVPWNFDLRLSERERIELLRSLESNEYKDTSGALMSISMTGYARWMNIHKKQ